MPAQRFSVSVDPDALAQHDLAAALSRPAAGKPTPPAPADAQHHGARDSRQAARQRSERDHAGRAAGVGSGRSYAFRRS